MATSIALLVGLAHVVVMMSLYLGKEQQAQCESHLADIGCLYSIAIPVAVLTGRDWAFHLLM